MAITGRRARRGRRGRRHQRQKSVIAPEHFLEAAISENVFAGNAMSRRLQWQYPCCWSAIRSATSTRRLARTSPMATLGLIAPNHIIGKDIEEMTVDGVKMVFQNAPDTEAPVEDEHLLPSSRRSGAEIITGTIHNIYTPRRVGAQRAQLVEGDQQALYKFGQEAEVMFASHSWPRWGQRSHPGGDARAQRDAYANLNNQTLHYANLGVTINEIQNVYEVPKSLRQQWAARSYHGDVQNNVRGRDQPFPRALRRQPDQPDPAVARRLGPALRGDDGRRREDHPTRPAAL